MHYQYVFDTGGRISSSRITDTYTQPYHILPIAQAAFSTFSIDGGESFKIFSFWNISYFHSCTKPNIGGKRYFQHAHFISIVGVGKRGIH